MFLFLSKTIKKGGKHKSMNEILLNKRFLGCQIFILTIIYLFLPFFITLFSLVSEFNNQLVLKSSKQFYVCKWCFDLSISFSLLQI